MNASVNSYRRLDPAYEAPNEIKFSAIDRGSMIRIPEGNECSSRIEAGFKAMNASAEELKKMEAKVYGGKVKKLPSDIYVAMDFFKKSKFMKDVLGKENHSKYLELKEGSAHRCPKDLGSKVKAAEVLYHHEITNQLIWDDF